MDPLKALKAEINVALNRGGSGAARRESDQEVARKAGQGMRIAKERQDANESDFGRHFEEWHGSSPEPSTPREDPQHAAKAAMGRGAEFFLMALKIVFWLVFGPVYFDVLAWLALIIAIAISTTLSLGVKPLIANGIWKPGLTPQENARRLHANVIAGIIAFSISFGGLFLLRGLAGPLANVGALLVLPVLSVTDLVLLYLMGVAHAYVQLYSWAAAFVLNHHEYSRHFCEFEHQHQAACNRLGEPERKEIAHTPSPAQLGPAGNGANPAGRPLGIPGSQPPANATVSLTMLALAIGLTLMPAVYGQVPQPSTPSAVSQDVVADLRLDSTTSLYPSISNTITPVLTNSFYIWSSQVAARRLRVSTFERDGWLPRTIAELFLKGTPQECVPGHGEGIMFRGISEALKKDAFEACQRATAAEAKRVQTELTDALTSAWRTDPLGGRKQKSCTAFNDALAAAARVPARNLIVLVSDTEETCKPEINVVHERAAGASVIVILVPSKSDMGPGVSAAARFNVKKTQLLKFAPWLLAVLAPAEVESYRLPSPTAPVIKASWESK
jgi:hypothetical protein